MESFFQFLVIAKNGIKQIGNYESIKIVLGNESCDLDSTISPLLLGYLLYNQFVTDDKKILILPVLNVSEANFLLHTENCYVLKKAGLDIGSLIFRDQIKFEEIITLTKVETYMVDHHVLGNNDSCLKETVVSIFDHRPLDINSDWDLNRVKVLLNEVGSCATLVADEIFKTKPEILTESLARLLYGTIIFDTIALLPENGKAKQLDIEIAKKIEEVYKFEINREKLFDELWAAHNDVSHLTPYQLLRKDLKIVLRVPVPGLPYLCEKFLQLEGACLALEKFAEEYASDLVLLIGLEAVNGTVKRGLAVFCTGRQDSSRLKDLLIGKLLEKSNGFGLTEVDTAHKNVKCYHQENIRASRKQIIPILKDSITEFNNHKQSSDL